MINENFSAILYLISSVFFILALKGLSSPETARRGNIFGILGMLTAVSTLILQPNTSNFIPVVNHVWGSAVSIATNLHLLTAQPDMPGGLFPSKSMLELDTTEKNIFITDLPTESFSIFEQIKENNGFASVSDKPGIGIIPNLDFIKEFEVNE